MKDEPNGRDRDDAGRDDPPLPLFREAPMTLALGAAWLLVYAAMVWRQGAFHAGGRDLLTGSIATRTAHLFGDQTPAEIGRGQAWRTLTSTFIHFSLLHLGLNLIGLLQFGRIIEGWYGSGPLLAIYVAIGSLGNALSGVLKLRFSEWLRADPLRPSGGGSGVVVGLIALLAIAGWRSSSRFGDFVRGQMFLLLFLTGVMGLFYPRLDNTGHATGAAVGLLIGLLHPLLLKAGRWPRRLLGVVAALVLAAAAAVQYRAARVEIREESLAVARIQAQRLTLAYVELSRLYECYRELIRRGSDPRPPFDPLLRRPTGPSRDQLRAAIRNALAALQGLRIIPESGPVAAAGDTMRNLSLRALAAAPTPGAWLAFRAAHAIVMERVKQELAIRLLQLNPSAASPKPKSAR
jgi:rhomboid protease GluP